MFSKNFKRKVAVLLTGVMVLGMTVTASAADKSGSSNGTGTFEGHANSTIVSVTLPTVSESSTAFNYIYDPEGLIAGTTHAAYPNASFTGSQVYFETAKDTYTGESKTLSVSNNSMVSINVTVKVETESGGNKDPKLVSSNSAATSATDPSLYLGLKVGDKPAKALMGSAVEVSVSLNGMPNNYTLSYNSTEKKYSYVMNKNATGWESVGFSVEGAANKVKNAKDSTAPTLKVTWSYEPVGDVEEEGGDTPTPPAADKAPSIATTAYNYDRTADLPITVSLGSGTLKATDISKVSWAVTADGSYSDFAKGTKWTFEGTTLTFKSGTFGSVAVNDKRYIKVTFDEGTSVVLTLTIAK
jgi:hypothetical protein